MDDRPGQNADPWPTLTEAATRTGHTREALRQRVRRGRLRAVRGNDGMVHVDPSGLADLPPPGATTDDQVDEIALSVDVLVATVADLRADLVTARSTLDEANAGRLVDRGRAERAEAERDAAAARTSAVEADLASARAELVAARQQLADEQRAMQAELRRPGWRRLLGWP